MIMNTSTILKFFKLITFTHQKKYFYFIFLYFFNLIIELLGIGLIIPFLHTIISEDFYLKIISYLTFLDINYISKNQFILLFIGFLLIIFVVKAISLTYISYVNLKFLNDIKLNISKKLFNTYLNQPFNFYLENNSTKLTSHINDITAFISVTNSGIILINESLILFSLLIVSFIFKPIITIIILILFGIGALFFYKKVQSKTKILGDIKQKNNILIFNQIKESFGAIKELIILGKINYAVEKFVNYCNESAKSDFKQSFFLSLPRIWLELFGVIGINLILIFIIYSNMNILTFVPTIGFFVVILYRFMPSITRIMNAIQAIKFNTPIIENIYEQLFVRNFFLIKKIDNNNSVIFNKNIKLKNIKYLLKENQKLLFDISNFNINKNSFLGIVGPSGVGKTTLLNIILGLIDPDNGVIEVDGIDIRNNLKSWHKIIGYVPQNIYLNDDSLFANIALGVPEKKINFNLIKEVIHLSQLDKFVEMLPQGINTIVGELGDKISGGQKQRIGIARALYNQPEIIIFDEATNSLDEDTEETLIKEISLLKEKTVIFVSHRTKNLEKYAELYELSKFGLVKKN